jgi:hypothetical protein
MGGCNAVMEGRGLKRLAACILIAIALDEIPQGKPFEYQAEFGGQGFSGHQTRWTGRPAKSSTRRGLLNAGTC